MMAVSTINAQTFRCVGNTHPSPPQLSHSCSTAAGHPQALHRLASATGSPAAVWPRTAPMKRTARCQAMPSEIMSLADAGVAGLGSAIDAMVSSGGTPLGSEIAQDFQKFEPQMNPFVAVAALAAAVPPILFWSRVFLNARRRIKEDEQKELERQERKKKLYGDP